MFLHREALIRIINVLSFLRILLKRYAYKFSCDVNLDCVRKIDHAHD